MNSSQIKKNGVHYTPVALAGLLARSAVAALPAGDRDIHVLDPACGDGMLLAQTAAALPAEQRSRLYLYGCDRDDQAIATATATLSSLSVAEVHLQHGDYLQSELAFAGAAGGGRFDLVIANPPYVRTQVLGADQSQILAKRFGLSGRVDLYHAFSIAMAQHLVDGGVLGLLTSNRFLSVKSGIAMRQFLLRQFAIDRLIDLGDTRLFNAAVLPVIMIAHKHNGGSNATAPASFVRIYEQRQPTEGMDAATQFGSVLQAVEDPRFTGVATIGGGCYRVQRGQLTWGGPDQVWSLQTAENQRWLATLQSRTFCRFGDIAEVRVGIKSTADAVFIRTDWDTLNPSLHPEPELLRPLITHHQADRWQAAAVPRQPRVLYPHQIRDGKRRPIDLDQHPRAAAYLAQHETRLRSRQYVTASGRAWYEIWVPHHPDQWAAPKIVAPDIAERPTFFLNTSGAVVNGDCYWMKLKQNSDEDWLYLLLAVANSTLIEQYYDVCFHNKLYAGRRRFMTQYVKQFPLPDLASSIANEIVAKTRRLVARPPDPEATELAQQVDRLVSQALLG